MGIDAFDGKNQDTASAADMSPENFTNLDELFQILARHFAELTPGTYPSPHGSFVVTLGTAGAGKNFRLVSTSYSMTLPFVLEIEAGSFASGRLLRGRGFQTAINTQNELTQADKLVFTSLIQWLKGLPGLNTVDGRVLALEDRINAVLADEGKPPYIGSPEVNRFYKRP